MDNSDLNRLSADITALNVALQQTKNSQERLADTVDALRRENEEAREEGQGFGSGLLGTIFGGVLIGTMIGNVIGGLIAELSRSERTTASGDTRRKDPP